MHTVLVRREARGQARGEAVGVDARCGVVEPHHLRLGRAGVGHRFAGQGPAVEVLGGEGALEQGQQLVVRAADLVPEHDAPAEPGLDALGGGDAVVRVHLRAATSHDLRGPGVRADEGGGGVAKVKLDVVQ